MDYIPARALNEYVYCPRLFYIMYVKGDFIDSADTVSGAAQHERAGRTRHRVSDDTGDHDNEGATDGETWPSVPRELTLGDEKLGVIAKLDAIEQKGGFFSPVEAKHGPAPDGDKPFYVEGYELDSNAWNNDQVQLCCQGMLLEANGYPAKEGYLYYRGSRKRVRVEFNEKLKSATLSVIAAARRCAEGKLPPPLVDSPKCIRCSMNSVCLPDEVNMQLGRIEEPRRIVPGRADMGVLYITTQGARLGKSGEGLVVRLPDGAKDVVPLKDVAAVCAFGNVQVTTQALHLLMASGRQVAFMSRSGRLFGLASGLTVKNSSLRRLQVLRFEDEQIALDLARAVVRAKLKNQRTLLRRNTTDDNRDIQDALKTISERIDSVSASGSFSSLLGEEGLGAKVYFEKFPLLLKHEFFRKRMHGRSKRPPKDPVNAALSFGYALLLRDFIASCATVGFDPMIGFFHATEAGRPALALDLMEPFRPLVVDSLVLRLINTGALKPEHFHVTQANVLLSDAGRRAFITGYEQRMDEMVTHPQFGYRMSYRRILELEVRMLARVLEGELEEYRPLVTR